MAVLKGTHGPWADLAADNENADFTLIGIPFDGLASARSGAAGAPERMRELSQHLTPFSEDRTPLKNIRIHDAGDIKINDPETDYAGIRAMIAKLKNIPITLGGDHSVAIPVLEGQRERFKGKRLGVLWIDAHPDLCDEFNGSRISHACVMRRGFDAGIDPKDVCMVGLRSWEEQEIGLIENSGLHACTAQEIAQKGIGKISADVRKILSRCDAIHISLDIDALDPAFAPGTGIPEAGGLSSREVLSLLQSLEGMPLVGLDIVEVAPSIDPSDATVFAALKIMMEFVALSARAKLRR